MTPCPLTCLLSSAFILGMVYFYVMTERSTIVQNYKSSLSPTLQQRYEKIRQERLAISSCGYLLGLVLSLGIIAFSHVSKNMSNTAMVCLVIAVSFITNYFYYMLHPKSDWMLNHMSEKKDVQAWLRMYREMQFNYHMGLALGIVGVGVLACAFRK